MKHKVIGPYNVREILEAEKEAEKTRIKDEPWVVMTEYGVYKINAYQLIYITTTKKDNKEKNIVEARNVYGQTIAVFTEVVYFARVRNFKGGNATTEDET